VLFGFAGSIPEARLNALRRHPLVEYVDFDGMASIPPTVQHHSPGHGRGNNSPAPEGQITPWGIHRIGEAENGATGSGVSVFILDTGIAPNHPDLQANLGQGYAPLPCEGDCINPWDDDHGHGTHVAGTVGAIDNDVGVVGVAPQVTLHSVKVLGSDNRGPWSGIVSGIDWVVAQETDKPRIINLSLGGTGSDPSGICTMDGYQGSNFIHETVCNAKNAGVIIVAAAGNSGGDAAFYVPASYYDAVIAVSAVRCDWESEERCKEGTEGWTTWSNWGLGSDDAWPSRHSLPVLIGAPGATVRSTTWDGGYGNKSGTSMAAPHVAGAVALLIESGSDAMDGSAFARVRQALLDNAECTAGWNNTSGNPHFESFVSLQSGSGECAPAEPPPPPPAPEIPTTLEATALSSSQIKLTWAYEEPVPEDIDFQVSRWDGSGWITFNPLGQDLSWTNSWLPPEAEYTYRVRAVRNRVSSEWSKEATARTYAIADLEATFTYACSGDVCDFVADHGDDSAYYTWDFGHAALGEEQGAWQASTRFPGAGEYAVELRIRIGTATASHSQPVACLVRGRNLRCG
jgi:subtilisin